MNDADLLRYSRQILLPQVDLSGQERITQSRVLIAGVGGLGAPVAMYLAAAGVGELILCDGDKVELSNLARQIIYTENQLDAAKVHAAASTLKHLNTRCRVTTVAESLDEQNFARHLTGVVAVVDCTDNLTTRRMINRACYAANIPLVSGAAVRFEGQLMVCDFQAYSPCYECFVAAMGEAPQSCAQNGVFSPLVGVIGAMQAVETLKIVAGLPVTMVGRVVLYDALKSRWREFTLPRNPYCSVCAGRK